MGLRFSSNGWAAVAATFVLAGGQSAGCTGKIGNQGASSGNGGVQPDPTPGTLVCRADANPDVGPAPLRRLTRQEYANSVRDLLGAATAGVSDDLPADETLGAFATNTVTSISELGTQQYMDAAERLALAVVGRVDALVDCDRAAMGDAACGAAFIDRFGARAFRRPLTADEKTRYRALYDAYSGGGFAEGIRLVVQTMLQSAHFLYHVEWAPPPTGTPAGAVIPLTPYETAARLSFFLWNSVPDGALMDAAAAGALDDPAGLRAQAERMLADPRAADALASFHNQWLDLGKLPALTKDPAIFPQYTPALGAAMQSETLAFVGEVLSARGDGRLETLLTAPWSVLDGPLFELYGVARPAGTSGPVRVSLDPTQRAGLLTQAAFLATHAHENQTSPVARGVAVLRNVLCRALPDPPANVNNAPPEPTPGATLRQRLAVHEEDPSCGGCHKPIDGIGLGFESYDALGAFRATDQGLPIDATGKVIGTATVDGPFDGAVELAGKLAASVEVQECVARQWFRFALARVEGSHDGCSMSGILEAFRASDHDVRTLLASIATSDAFRYRMVEAP